MSRERNIGSNLGDSLEGHCKVVSGAGVETFESSDTLQSLASRMAYADAPFDRFLVLNGLASKSRLVAGQKVKLVT